MSSPLLRLYWWSRLEARAGAASLALSAVLVAGCSTPLHRWDVHTTATPRTSALDVSALARQPVATLGLMTPSGLQGFSPSVSHALAAALAEASSSVQSIPPYEIVSRLNEEGLAAEYADLVTGFARSGILERERLRRIGAALGSRYVLQPGMAAFTESIGDEFEIAGWKALKTRVSTLRLWLQLWDCESGRLLWESGGEVTVAAHLLSKESTVSLGDIARRLWEHMIQDGLRAGKTKSSFTTGP